MTDQKCPKCGESWEWLPGKGRWGCPGCNPQGFSAPKSSENKYGDGYDVGDIVEHSWGYDQTNIDFFRIVKRTEHFVSLWPMGSKQVETLGSMSGKVVPTDDLSDTPELRYRFSQLWGPLPLRRKLARDRKDAAIIVGLGIASSYGWASKWDGEPAYCSSYA